MIKALRQITGIGLLAALFSLGIPGAEGAAGESGLPLPRFVSLRADKVNLRAGPGVRYPIEWVLVRRNMPVEVFAEFDNWRKVRDWEGTVGWIHESMAGSRRTVIVVGETRPLRRADNEQAHPVAELKPGVVAWLVACPEGSGFCQVEVNNKKGWLDRNHLWGVHRGEYFQ